jgi:hypothetical protein
MLIEGEDVCKMQDKQTLARVGVLGVDFLIRD